MSMISEPSDLGKLRGFPFFARLSDSAFSGLARRCTRKVFRPGDWIVGHRDDTHDVLFLLDGSARVNIYSSDGRRVSLREIAEGAIFGELAAIDGLPRSASVECVKACSVAVMPRQTFIQALDDHPEFRMAVLTHITQMVRTATERVFEFSTLSVRGRVHAELLRIAPVEAGHNESVLSPAPTHEEIASRIGTHREAVTRELSSLEDLGVIAKEGRTLRITNLAELRRLASQEPE